ncbi:MAG: sugar ABC transporter ATP-binding protein [Pararhodobacter sp.]|nr:sugar ABC transporter ATP-binding protein [Pararhodobacter sp.]
MTHAIEIRDLRKSFGATEVLKGISLNFTRGEVHAFLGANGAGKSTLLGCLSGAITPTEGVIRIGGKEFQALTPRLAQVLGLAIIYQHFQVFEGLTVADNIFLGHEMVSYGYVRASEQNRIAKELLKRLGVDIDPRALIDDLSVGERQLVEIARALRHEPKILILDEPTAALSSKEMKSLHNVVRQLASRENLAIVYVTHLIDEIDMIADRVSILRDGQVIWTRELSDASHDEITRAIAPNLERGEKPPAAPRTGKSLLECRGYHSDFTGPIDLELHAGEVVGIYGLLGSGRTDLLESLVGARKQRGGELFFDGRQVRNRDPQSAFSAGLALVASDRKEQSLFPDLSALENLLMPHFGGYAGGKKRQLELFHQIADRLQLQPRLPHQAGERFSGGNAQKLMMGRWLFPDLGIKVLLLDEPTQGVDVGAREDLYFLLRDFTASGGAILFSSSDPEEVVALSHRAIIVAKGRQAAMLEGDEITEEHLVDMAHKFSNLETSSQ